MTKAAGKLGAQEILDWYRGHEGQVCVEPTAIFRDELTLLELGRRPSRDFGERAALEVIRTLPLGENERALLLSDDRDAARLVIVDPEKLILLTTWDYLRQLEEAQRIQSADAVIDAARAAGPTRRNAICGAATTRRTAMRLKPSSAAGGATRQNLKGHLDGNKMRTNIEALLCR